MWDRFVRRRRESERWREGERKKNLFFFISGWGNPRYIDEEIYFVFLLSLVQRYVPFCIVPVRRNRLLSNVFVFLACKSVSNILPGYCSGTLEIMKKKLFQIRIFWSELCCLGAKKMFRMVFFRVLLLN